MSDASEPRRVLVEVLHEAVEAVSGRACVARHLRGHPLPAPVHLLAIGKAASRMAAGAGDALGERIAAALVLTKHGHCEPLPAGVAGRCLESAHPVPDASSLAAGRALLEFAAAVPADANALVLTSGGASSLVEVLPEGVPDEALARIHRWLLGSGLAIGPMNRVRKRISCIKAGRLAAVLGAACTRHLLISDVPGDDPRVIGSGLLAPHAPADVAVDDLALPGWLRALLDAAPSLAPPEAFAGIESVLVATPGDARRAAARAAGARGHEVREDQTLVEGDAIAAGRSLAARTAGGPPGVQVWSGETTVRLPERPGRGGRCQSLALAAALEIAGREDLWLLAAGTDGSDGPGEDAGALVDGGTVRRGEQAGLDARACLAAADAGRFLEASGDLLSTGPTGTNVMDLMLGLRTA